MEKVIKYYVATPDGPVGPLSIKGLRARGLQPEDLVWCEGMETWERAADIPGFLDEVAGLPPKFDQERFDGNCSDEVRQGINNRPEYGIIPSWSDRPSNYIVLAVIGLILFFPLGIPAMIKACAVNPYWETGNVEKARQLSKDARKWGLIAVIVGLLFNLLYVNRISSILEGMSAI